MPPYAEPSPGRSFRDTGDADYPQKIYAEVTTRCNLRCRMCVKYASGSRIVAEDLPLFVFEKLESTLARAKMLILNGVGEPLLHPQLEEIIYFARKHMPPGAIIGFQSNGYLLDEEKCIKLISAGLSTLCLSLDCLDEEPEPSTEEHSVRAVNRAIAELTKAKKKAGNESFKTGLEMVLTRNNINDLPRYVRWAAERGADYVILTHLFLYTPATEELNLFNPNTSEAVQLFNSYKKRARILGLDLHDYPASRLKYQKSEKESATVKLFEEMQQEARDREINLHLQSLIQHTNKEEPAVDEIFAAAREIADDTGIALHLPANQTLMRRNCPFLAEKAVFIAADGAVMPCRFLSHTYCCRVLSEDIQVRHYPLGNIRQQPLEDIWRSPEYRAFRQEAEEYAYASCWSCSQGPCASLINDNIHLANDCYGSGVPCGHCQWNLGGIRCL